jgi:uncharacterized DUF497 family protein
MEYPVHMNFVVDEEVLEFDWDEGNYEKNWIKHQVKAQEAEEAFADENKIVFLNIKHLDKEERFFLIGKTYTNRFLAIAYTRRDEKVRVISARDANKKEVKQGKRT